MEINRYRQAAKKPLVFLFAIITVCLVVLLGNRIWFQPKSPVPVVTNAETNTIDYLFYKMGIIKIPAVSLPIDVHLKDIDGNSVKISNFKGNIVFLNFWATWCPGCRVEMPEMEKLHKRFKDDDFKMIAISLREPADRVKNYFKANHLSFTGLLDGNGLVGSRFGAVSIPTTYILNKNGEVVGKAIGAREWYGKASITLFEMLVDTGMDIP